MNNDFMGLGLDNGVMSSGQDVVIPRFSISKKYKTVSKTDIIKTLSHNNGFGPLSILIPGNRAATFSLWTDMQSQADAFSIIGSDGTDYNPGAPFGNVNITFPTGTPALRLNLNVTANGAQARDVWYLYVTKTYDYRVFNGFNFSYNGWR